MKPRALGWIAAVTGGSLQGADGWVDAVAIDTRALPSQGQPLFVALKGENFDGHAHVQAAANGGCVAALVAHPVDANITQIIVPNTERALADLAAAAQRERSTKVLAVTGSNGKTSVKTLLLSILNQLGGAYANPGNRNNEIGLPLAVLDAPEDARFAVYEMGAGKPGDIAYLTAIARPERTSAFSGMPCTSSQRTRGASITATSSSDCSAGVGKIGSVIVSKRAHTPAELPRPHSVRTFQSASVTVITSPAGRDSSTSVT